MPEGVPQPFTSASLSRVAEPHGASLLHQCRKTSLLARHNLARVGRLRRALGIPNPIWFYCLADELAANWAAIRTHLGTSRLSITRPVRRPTIPRAVEARIPHPDRAPVRARHRAMGRFVLVADIQRCYPAIYTHSIPWALHSKSVAKVNRSRALLGNRLDRLVSLAQDGQTRGIPIGPDTSFVISEIVLTGVDQILEQRLGRIAGFRASDDFEIVFSSRGVAEEGRAILQEALASFELEINEEKTRIQELPEPLDDTWPLRLRTLPLRTTGRAITGDLVTYFGIAFELSKAFPTDSVLRYAISRVHGITMPGVPWPLYHDLLMQCATAEPGTLKFVLSELRRYKSVGYQLDDDRLREALTALIVRHTPLGHGSEVAWAVWAHISLGITLAKPAADLLPTLDDSLVPLLALHADDRGLVPSGLDKSAWASAMTGDGLYGPHWLLAYEANIKGWLPSVGPDHVAADPYFRQLKSKGVSFYNVRAPSVTIRRWRRRLGLAALALYDFGAV